MCFAQHAVNVNLPSVLLDSVSNCCPPKKTVNKTSIQAEECRPDRFRIRKVIFFKAPCLFAELRTSSNIFFLPSSFHFFKFPRIIFGFRRGREKVLPNKKLRRKKLFKVCSNVQIRLFYNISPAKFWQTANCNWMNTNYELKL